jgi:hypothetical protein
MIHQQAYESFQYNLSGTIVITISYTVQFWAYGGLDVKCKHINYILFLKVIVMCLPLWQYCPLQHLEMSKNVA